MKTKAIYIGLILVCCLITSCDYEVIRPEGEIITKEAHFTGYSSLHVSDAFKVYIRFSDTEEKIEIAANENLHSKIRVEMEGNTLNIRFKDHTNIKGAATLNVFITTESIVNYDITGASRVTLESELVASKANIQLSGASGFSGGLNLDQLKLDAKGASDINVFGKANFLDASLQGASTLQDYDLNIETIDLQLSGASTAHLSITESINIDASGASKLYYKGDAAVNQVRLSGASEIIKN